MMWSQKFRSGPSAQTLTKGTPVRPQLSKSGWRSEGGKAEEEGEEEDAGYRHQRHDRKASTPVEGDTSYQVEAGGVEV